jgi:hypothetical protein
MFVAVARRRRRRHTAAGTSFTSFADAATAIDVLDDVLSSDDDSARLAHRQARVTRALPPAGRCRSRPSPA